VSRRRRPSRIHGLLPVFKTAGPTSHDVVDMARLALGERRIGHTGTLDPMAEGLLLLCVGNATRLQRFLMDWEKAYRGVVRLGHATTTYDLEGEAMDPRGPVPVVGPAELETLRERFSGDIDQVPPPYSAKKVEGKKMYELARDGQAVELEAKRVTVRDLELSVIDPERLEVRVTCSTGFYVRSLAYDLGVALGCGGHLESLLREGIGPYTIDVALPQAVLGAGPNADTIVGGPAWVPLDDIRLPFPDLAVNRGAAERFLHGQETVVFRSGGGDDLSPEASVCVRDEGGTLLGVGTVQSVLARGRTVGVRPSVVLATAVADREHQTH